MNALTRLLISGLLLAALPAAPVLATTVIERSLDELLQAAELGFHGTVSAVEAQLLDGEPWTAVTFEVLELLLADPEEPAETESVTLLFLGGATGGEELSVALMPAFEPGAEVLLLAYSEQYWSPIVGFNQAVWYLDGSGSWLSPTGTSLSLDDSGRLLLAGADAQAPAADVVAALRERLELR